MKFSAHEQDDEFPWTVHTVAGVAARCTTFNEAAQRAAKVAAERGVAAFVHGPWATLQSRVS